MADQADDRVRSSDAWSMSESDRDEQLADERERLADERERLADEQDRLADERERLADENERSLDRWTSSADETEQWAQEQLLRAEARVRRALAEQERARVTLERVALRNVREHAAKDRVDAEAARQRLDGEDLRWANDRRDFVAMERSRLADRRDDDADVRDGLALQREQIADDRDADARQREKLAASDLDRDPTRVRPGERHPAGDDLAEVRETARRQRAVAAETRQHAVATRAQATRQRSRAGTPNGTYGPSLSREFTALTRELFMSQDLFAVAQRVADLSKECIAGAVSSGVTMFEGVRPMTHVATDEVARQLDELQVAGRDGPIGAALGQGAPIWSTDLSRDGRWPAFSAAAAERGIRGVVACELAVRRGRRWESLGSLAVYTDTAGQFRDDVGDTVALFAAHLAVVAAFDRDRHDVRRREAALHRALSSRDVIGQAKGILMERQYLTAGQAFDVLRASSQQLNIKLQEVAARLTESGELPA